MLSVQPIHCIKKLLQMVVGPPVSTSCPFTFSNFQLFITLSRNRFFFLIFFFAKCLLQIDICNQRRPYHHYQDKLLKCSFAHNSTNFVEKHYCFQHIKAWEWDLTQTTTVKNALFGIPTNIVPNLTRPW